MKKGIRFICLILACSLFLAFPAQAASAVESRGSAFFSAYGTDLEKTGERVFRIWFDVNANAAYMDEIGVSEIVLYRSANGHNWTEMRTYQGLSQMIAYNDYSHTGYVTYNYATPGYYYTARVTFYAKNSTGVGERDVYTEILQM